MEIKKKEFTYRGMTLEQLKNLDVREFAKLAPARSRRTILRNFQEIEDFLARAKKKQLNKKQIKTHKRDLVVVPQMVGMKIGIYNGKEFIFNEIMVEMLGYKFGEFSLSRAKVKHGSAGVGATKGSNAKAKH